MVKIDILLFHNFEWINNWIWRKTCGNLIWTITDITHLYHLYDLEIIPINSLPHNKILDVTTFKAFADDKINKMMISVFYRVEKIVGKEGK